MREQPILRVKYFVSVAARNGSALKVARILTPWTYSKTGKAKSSTVRLSPPRSVARVTRRSLGKRENGFFIIDNEHTDPWCPNCDDHVHSARSVRGSKMMPFDNPLTVVRTETLTSTPLRQYDFGRKTRLTSGIAGPASRSHRGTHGTEPSDGADETA